MKTKLIIISLTLILAGSANLVMASEVTGILSTGLNGNVNQTLTGTVIVPIVPPVVVPPVSSGGGGGGSPAPAPIISPAPVVPLITPVVPTITPKVLGASIHRFTQILKVGSSNDDVKELQNQLTLAGVYQGPITGYFGNLTKTALKLYQKKNKLAQSGILDKKTIAVMNVASEGSSTPLAITATPKVLGAPTVSFTKILRLGANSNEVKDLQERLKADGVYAGPVTGYFGNLTKVALKAYQKKNKLSPSGILNKPTMALLNK